MEVHVFSVPVMKVILVFGSGATLSIMVIHTFGLCCCYRGRAEINFQGKPVSHRVGIIAYKLSSVASFAFLIFFSGKALEKFVTLLCSYLLLEQVGKLGMR